MSAVSSISAGRPYGVARVCRLWNVARAGVYVAAGDRVARASAQARFPRGRCRMPTWSRPSARRSPAAATFGLIATNLGGVRFRPAAIPWLVGLYVTAADWFTASTSFANPAVAIALGFSDTVAGIRHWMSRVSSLPSTAGAIPADITEPAHLDKSN